MDRAALERYAELIVRFAANVQPGQIVELGSEIGKEELTRAVAAAAYQAGATHVAVTYDDLHVKRARILHAPEAALGFAPDWVRRQVQELNERHGASIYLSGAAEPGILEGLDTDRLGRDRSPEAVDWQDAINARTVNWTVVPAPTAAWAAPGSITVNWQPPTNRGSAIVSYLLTTNTGDQRTVAAGTTSATLTGLDPTVQVNATVSATNGTGRTSQASAPSNSLYPSDTTLAPDRPTLEAGKDAGGTRTITVSWSEPEARGDPAESYTVTVNGSANSVTAPTTSFVIKSVRDGQPYTVTVAAKNHVGSSASSSSASITTNPDQADVTAAEPVDPNGDQVRVKVTVKPSSAAGGTIELFDIFANGTKVDSGGATQTVTVPSFGRYSFTARA